MFVNFYELEFLHIHKDDRPISLFKRGHVDTRGVKLCWCRRCIATKPLKFRTPISVKIKQEQVQLISTTTQYLSHVLSQYLGYIYGMQATNIFFRPTVLYLKMGKHLKWLVKKLAISVISHVIRTVTRAQSCRTLHSPHHMHITRSET